MERKYQETKISVEFMDEVVMDKSVLRPIENEKFSWLTYKNDDHEKRLITFQTFDFVPNFLAVRVHSSENEEQAIKEMSTIMEANKKIGQSLCQYEFWKADFDGNDFMENMHQIFFKLKTYQPLVN